MKGCDYQGYEFRASYLDSVCIKGYLHDADDCDNEGRIYLHPDEAHIPCPKCNKDEHTKWKEENNND